MKCPYCAGKGQVDAEQLGFGGMVLLARTEAGLTQDQLADAVGVSRAQIANIEAGRSSVPADAIRKYAAALNVDALALLP